MEIGSKIKINDSFPDETVAGKQGVLVGYKEGGTWPFIIKMDDPGLDFDVYLTKDEFELI